MGVPATGMERLWAMGEVAPAFHAYSRPPAGAAAGAGARGAGAATGSGAEAAGVGAGTE